MRKLIHDCDNTMGVEGCEIDDGLAILYLLGKPDIELLGITSIYGNSDVETVYSNTQAMMKEIGKGHIPVTKGSSGKKDRGGEAARYIVDTVRLNEGAISILATGPLTNLYAAYLLDESLFEKVQQIVLMGGITKPLIINGMELAELNFSCDPEATECVLRNGKNVSVITGHTCLDAFFSEQEFRERLASSKSPLSGYMLKKCSSWFGQMAKKFNIAGFYNWDVAAAVYLAEPSLFKDSAYRFEPDINNLKRGLLTSSDTMTVPSCKINIPKILDTNALIEEVYHAWLG